MAAVYTAFVQAARGSRDTFLKALLRRFDAAATLPPSSAEPPDLRCSRFQCRTSITSQMLGFPDVQVVSLRAGLRADADFRAALQTSTIF